MTSGWIGNNRELVMPLRLLDVNEHVHRIEANIDTGFNGHLTLPPGLTHLLGFISDKPLDLTMAKQPDGKVSHLPRHCSLAGPPS